MASGHSGPRMLFRISWWRMVERDEMRWDEMGERFRDEANRGGGEFWKVEVELHDDEDGDGDEEEEEEEEEEEDEGVRRVPSRRCNPWMLPAVPEFVPWELRTRLHTATHTHVYITIQCKHILESGRLPQLYIVRCHSTIPMILVPTCRKP